MKAHAICGRDKPKDSYDFCYCLEHSADGVKTLAADWRKRRRDKIFAKAIAILREKFADVSSFGPQQVVEFHDSTSPEEQEMQARRAYELVRQFLDLIG